jgi:pilus assembly protein CpaE
MKTGPVMNKAANLDAAWRLPEGDEPEFVLDEDASFGEGALEGLDQDPTHALAGHDGPAPPPMDHGFDEDPFGLTTPAPSALSADANRSTEQPVPRITIHACCDRDEIARLVSGIASDRRLARAEISVEGGGIEAALARFGSQASPNLLILDTVTQGPVMLRNLDRLAQVMEEGVKVVIIGAVNDIGLFRELMARGVSEYIVPPIQPVDLIRAICAQYVNPDKPFAGRVISVIGARGGAGASTIAHNIAWSIAERPEAGATLLDLDL